MSESRRTPRTDGAGSSKHGAVLLAEPPGHAQKLAGIGRFANVIAHDFNNLLTVIRAYAEMALRERALDARLREQLEAIRSAADSAAWLSQQLLAHSRRDSGRAAIVDVNLMLRDIHQLLGRSLPAGVTAELRLQDDLRPILADPGPVGQVLLSALTHVGTGLPTGGRLVIESADVALAPHLSSPMLGAVPASPVWVRVSGTTSSVSAMRPGEADARARPTTPAAVPAGTTPLDDHGLSLAAAEDSVRALPGAMSVTGNAHDGWVIDIALPGVNVQPLPAERRVTTTGPFPPAERHVR